MSKNSTIEGLDAWAQAGVHNIMLPTGVRVDVRIPDLAAIIEGGELPQNLLDAALSAASQQNEPDAKKVSVEDIAREREFTDFLVSKTLVKPEVSPDQARQIPTEDREMIASIALRLRDMDAEYKTLGGLEKSENFRKVRKLGEFDTPVEGL